MNPTALEFEHEERSLSDYLSILRRRKNDHSASGNCICPGIAGCCHVACQISITRDHPDRRAEVPRILCALPYQVRGSSKSRSLIARLMTVETISKIADKFDLYRDDKGKPYQAPSW